MNNIEPPWAGIERSILNFFLWIGLTFVLIPMPVVGFLYVIWWLCTDDKANFLLCYGLALILGSTAFLKHMHKNKRVYVVVKSQRVLIVTNDLPASHKREASDSREETPLHGVKLGEGTHILNPFDQEYADIPIEIEYQVSIIEPFRVTIGGNHMLDLMVKSAVADFKTDSEHLLALARIDLDETKRQQKIQTRMKAYIQRFIEEECRLIANRVTPDGKQIDPAEKSSEISDKVEQRLKDLLNTQFPGFELKSFTLGDVNKPTKVEDARDLAAKVEQMTLAAANMLSINNAKGAPAGSQMTPQETLDVALIAAGIKTTTKTEKGLRIDPETIAAVGSVLATLARIFKP